MVCSPSKPALLSHFLQLSPEHSSIVAIKRDMEPIPFLALDDEFVGSSKIWWRPDVYCPVCAITSIIRFQVRA